MSPEVMLDTWLGFRIGDGGLRNTKASNTDRELRKGGVGIALSGMANVNVVRLVTSSVRVRRLSHIGMLFRRT